MYMQVDQSEVNFLYVFIFHIIGIVECPSMRYQCNFFHLFCFLQCGLTSPQMQKAFGYKVKHNIGKYYNLYDFSLIVRILSLHIIVIMFISFFSLVGV